MKKPEELTWTAGKEGTSDRLSPLDMKLCATELKGRSRYEASDPELSMCCLLS